MVTSKISLEAPLTFNVVAIVFRVQGLKAETHDAINCCDISRRQVPLSPLMLRQVAAVRHLFGARNRFWKRNVNYFKFNMAGN